MTTLTGPRPLPTELQKALENLYASYGWYVVLVSGTGAVGGNGAQCPVTSYNMAPKVAPKLEPGFEMVAGYKRKIPPQNRPVPLPAALGAPMMYQQQCPNHDDGTRHQRWSHMVDHHTCVNSTNTSTVNPVAHVTPQPGEITQRDQQKLGSPYTSTCEHGNSIVS